MAAHLHRIALLPEPVCHVPRLRVEAVYEWGVR